MRGSILKMCLEYCIRRGQDMSITFNIWWVCLSALLKFASKTGRILLSSHIKENLTEDLLCFSWSQGLLSLWKDNRGSPTHTLRGQGNRSKTGTYLNFFSKEFLSFLSSILRAYKNKTLVMVTLIHSQHKYNSLSIKVKQNELKNPFFFF